MMINLTIISLLDAFVELLSPFVEVVVHNMRTNKIIYINGNISKRCIGDDSLLDIPQLQSGVWKNQHYAKLNFDGRLVKSISIPYEEEHAMICINCDVSIFHKIKTLAEQLLQSDKLVNARPEALFKNDWQDKLHIAIHHYLNTKHWCFESLTNHQKKQLLQYLFGLGTFEQKNSVDYLANILSMGRATIFNYLRVWRADERI